MATPSPQAGGFWIVLAIMAGTIVGLWQGQPSIGILVGTAVGVLVALLLYLRDRARARAADRDLS